MVFNQLPYQKAGLQAWEDINKLAKPVGATAIVVTTPRNDDTRLQGPVLTQKPARHCKKSMTPTV